MPAALSSGNGDSRFRSSADAHPSSVFQTVPRKWGLPRATWKHACKAERGASCQRGSARVLCCRAPNCASWAAGRQPARGSPAWLYRTPKIFSYGIVPPSHGRPDRRLQNPQTQTVRAEIVSELLQKQTLCKTGNKFIRAPCSALTSRRK
jgi:hypothetical protein